MQTQNTEQRAQPGKICFYHPRRDGKGAALQLDLRLNRPGEKGYDCFFLSMANQNGAPQGGQMASFDWHAKSVVKLGFLDICELLSVLEGSKPTAGNGKGGLFHKSGDGNTVVGFSRGTETPGYSVSVSRKNDAGDTVFRGHILLTDPEGIGIRSILQAALFFLTFHPDLSAALAPA